VSENDAIEDEVLIQEGLHILSSSGGYDVAWIFQIEVLFGVDVFNFVCVYYIIACVAPQVG